MQFRQIKKQNYTLTGDVICNIIYLIQPTISAIEGGALVSITSDIIRGHTETIILAHLIKGDSYGYEINKSIQQKSQNQYEFKEATLYTAFKRLEEAGSVNSYWGDELSGARRKYYSITNYGRQTYARLKEEWRTAKIIIDNLINMKG